MLYKEMNDQDLRDAYWSARSLLFNWSEIGTRAFNEHTRRKAARGTGRMLRDVEIIEAIARKRGISLARGAA